MKIDKFIDKINLKQNFIPFIYRFHQIFKIFGLNMFIFLINKFYYLKQMAQPLTQKEQLGISLLNETLLEQLRVKTMQPGRIDLA